MGNLSDNHSDLSAKQYERLGARVAAWRNKRIPTPDSASKSLEDVHKEQWKIEKEIGLRLGRLSKIETATQPRPDLFELEKLAQAMQMSCDELITGVAPANQSLHLETGLSNLAIQWLRQSTRQNPDYISMLNIILEDGDIASELLNALLLYANSEQISVRIGELENKFPVSLSPDKQEEVIENLALLYLRKVLKSTRNDWNPIISKRMEARVNSMLQKIMSPEARLQRLDEAAEKLHEKIAEQKRRDDGDDELPET